MEEQKVFARYASPNERRTISREDLGYYHAVIIGGIYRFSNGLNVESPQSLFAPLAACIAKHPFLSVVVVDKNTEKPFYQHVPAINLDEHVKIHDHLSNHDWTHAVGDLMRSDLDRPFPHGIPPWRVVVVPLPPTDPTHTRCLISFEYSHTIGDGPSGLAFHRSFFSGLSKSTTTSQSPIITTPTLPLPPPFDTRQRLPISWSFLLGPLIAAVLPTFISNLFGLKAQVSSTDQGTWTGTPCFFNPTRGAQSKATIHLIKSSKVEKAIHASRAHGAKLTGTMHQLIIRSLSQALGCTQNSTQKITNFVSTTPINMRRAVAVPDSEIGEFASGVHMTHPVSQSPPSTPLTEEEWTAAKLATENFAQAAVVLNDQPIGLLRYVPSIRKWMEGKLGQTRDASYELSNVGNVSFEEGKGEVEMENMVFSQPGHVTSHCINFNVVCVGGGDFVVCITWPAGSLGVGGEEMEEEFVRGVGEAFVQGFELFRGG